MSRKIFRTGKIHPMAKAMGFLLRQKFIIRQKALGRKPSKESIEKGAAKNREKWKQPEFREKMKNRPHGGPTKGFKHSLKTRELWSRQRQGAGNHNYGKHLKLETKQRISAKNSKLTWEKVDAIRERWSTGNISQGNLAEMYGVSKGCIQGIVEYTNWKPELKPKEQ
jgi:DNA-binding transcriptional regulator YiaG